MNGQVITHRGVVRRIEAGRAIVAMETSGCASCAQGSNCGIGKMANGRAATLLSLPASDGIRIGDPVSVALPECTLAVSALFGYFFPAIALLLGAWFGATAGGSDGATALGAMLGFFGALATVRIVAGVFPGLMPVPRLIPLSDTSSISPQELHHEH